MGPDRLAVAGPRAWVAWIRTIVGAVAATLAVRAVSLAVFDIPPAFQPLAVAGPTVFLTVVGAGAGLGVAVAIDKRSDRPVPLFQRVVVATLAVSLLPDFWLLTEQRQRGVSGRHGSRGGHPDGATRRRRHHRVLERYAPARERRLSSRGPAREVREHPSDRRRSARVQIRQTPAGAHSGTRLTLVECSRRW